MGARIRRTAILVVGAATIVMGAGTAQAGHPGSCPDSYTPISASVDPVVNKNGDDWICTKAIGAPPGTTAFSDIDNNAQGSH
jgi:hypothetical protein